MNVLLKRKLQMIHITSYWLVETFPSPTTWSNANHLSNTWYVYGLLLPTQHFRMRLELQLRLDVQRLCENRFKSNFVIYSNLHKHRKIAILVSNNGIPSGCITIRFADLAIGKCNGYKGNSINTSHMWAGRFRRDATAYSSRLHRIGELQSIVDDIEWIHSKSGSL